MLFALGGLLKSETRNFLQTKEKTCTDFKAPAPIKESNMEMEHLLKRTEREISQSDMKFFEESFIKYLVQFCDMIVRNAKPITKSNYDLYCKWNRKEWIDRVTDAQRKKLEPQTN